MKIFAINTVHWGSTGRIMHSIADCAKKHNIITVCYAPAGSKLNKEDLVFGYKFENRISSWISRLIGFQDVFSIIGTISLLRKIKAFKPDIIHFHNLHEWYLCLPLLFGYIKKYQIPVVWTLHDCWSFTGKCTHYASTGCEKWKTGCYDCPELAEYPRSYVDNTKFMWRAKKKWFSGIKKLTIVTPSRWLENQVNDSFLSDYAHTVINNGISAAIFQPTQGDPKQKYRIPENKTMLLGVSSAWNNKKGLDVFVELVKQLDATYQVVLVGVDIETAKQLPTEIITISRTNDRKELAELYSSADVFINPTREDTFPTVNMEAIACGTPVVTFDVCGSPEIVKTDCGIVVPENDINGLILAIETILHDRTRYSESCQKEASNFDENNCFEEYVSLYKSLCEEERNQS